MDCWHCGTELIWGGDHDLDRRVDGEESEYDFSLIYLVPNVKHTLKFIIVKKEK